MSDNKDKERQAKAPKTATGAADKQPASPKISQAQASGWKKILGKKWVFPATYVAAAAIILAIMWVIQDSGKTKIDEGDLTTNTIQNEMEADPTAAPPAPETEQMQWPANRSEVEVSVPFYDADATSEEKQAALMEYNNSFTPNMGIDLARKDNKPFDVLAALSGTVTRVDNLPGVGRLVEITHDGGLVTIYFSLSDVKVMKGDYVKQGDLIAKAGRNEIERDLGVHLHFEVQKDGEPVNPELLLAQADAADREAAAAPQQ